MRDVHSSYAAQIDSPAWRLVQALGTLVKADGHTPAVEGFFDNVKPLSPELKKILADAIPKRNEEAAKKAFGVRALDRRRAVGESLTRLVSQPTINIEGLVGGYTGPGGKTILPHRAVAKIDMRLVPDMTAKGTLELLKAHLAKRGFGDVEVNMTGGYDPTQTSADSKLVKAMAEAYRKNGIEPLLWPRLAGSWPGVTFTGAPLNLPAGQFGLGHGNGAHAPDEFWSSSVEPEGRRAWTAPRGRSWIVLRARAVGANPKGAGPAALDRPHRGIHDRVRGVIPTQTRHPASLVPTALLAAVLGAAPPARSRPARARNRRCRHCSEAGQHTPGTGVFS